MINTNELARRIASELEINGLDVGKTGINIIEQELQLFISELQLWSIKYRHNFSIGNNEEYTCHAPNKDAALDLFWKNRNKEGYEVDSITLIIN